MGDKIELQTQPEKNNGTDDPQHTIEKLKELVKEYPAEDDKDETSNEENKKSNEEDSESDDYDEDGFKVPSGKIPIDGHFTSKEIEQLVSIAQEEGFIKDDVSVEVLLRDENFGDKVVIEEKSEDEEESEDKHIAEKKKKKKLQKGDNAKEEEDREEEDGKEGPSNDAEKEKEIEEFKEHYLK